MPRSKANQKQQRPPFPGALNPALEASVEAAFDDAWEYGSQGLPKPGAIEVYADWLQEQGHPLGEQLVLEITDDTKWKKRRKQTDRAGAIAAGRAAHPALYGAGLPIGEDYKDPVRVRWRYGLIESIEIRTEHKKVIASCFEALARMPTARFVRTIQIANAASIDNAQLASFPALRGLTFWRGTPDLSAFSGGPLRSLSLPLLDEQAAAHLESMSRLSDLRVHDCTLDHPLAARALTRLTIGDSHHHARKLRSLEVVAKLAALESLSVEGGGIRALAPLAKLTALRSISIVGAKPLASLAGIERLGKLETLDVTQTAVTSLEPLRECRALVGVTLRNTKVKDLSPLWGLPALETIRAEKTKVKSLAGIEQLGKLKTLWIFDTPVRDLSPLAGVPSLEVLNIAGLAKAEHLEALADLPKLRSLDVMGMKPPFDPELVARAPALEDVRGCDWPPASRMVGKPLVLDAAAMKRSALPAGVRHVRLPRSAEALSVSDDGRLVAIALGAARDDADPVVEVYATEDGSRRHCFTKQQLGTSRGLCFLVDDSLLVIAGEGYHDLWRCELDGTFERLGRTDAWRIFRDGPGKTVALVQNNLRSVAFAPAKTPLKPSWTYAWGDHVPHVHWGAQVRFVGDTTRALLSGVNDMQPVLLDVKTRKVVRTITANPGAFADATRDGKHVVAWETSHHGQPPWLWLYRDDKPRPFGDEDYVASSAHVVFTPDGAHLMKLGFELHLASLEDGTAVGEPLETPARRSGTHSPGVLARKAPLVAWSSFSYRDGDFRVYWAAFRPGCITSRTGALEVRRQLDRRGARLKKARRTRSERRTRP